MKFFTIFLAIAFMSVCIAFSYVIGFFMQPILYVAQLLLLAYIVITILDFLDLFT